MPLSDRERAEGFLASAVAEQAQFHTEHPEAFENPAGEVVLPEEGVPIEAWSVKDRPVFGGGASTSGQ